VPLIPAFCSNVGVQAPLITNIKKLMKYLAHSKIVS